MVESELIESWAEKGIDSLPARGLRPGTLVVVLSPLTDERILRVVFDLAGRGHDLAVLECRRDRPRDPEDPLVADLARRLDRLERENVRAELRRAGVAVVPLAPGEAVDAAVMAAVAVRRRTRRRA